MVDLNYESNSNKSKEEIKNSPVVSHTVSTKEKSLSKKFAEVFLSDDIGAVKSFIFYDVVVPAIKETLSNVITGAVDMMLFGSTRHRSGPNTVKYGTVSGYTSYSSYSKPVSTSKSDEPYTYKDLIYENRLDAEEVLNALIESISKYGAASVADLFEYSGKTSQFTDNNYGWHDLSQASVRRVRGGYELNLPKATPLH